MRVLLVEDHKNLVSLLAKALAQAGLTCGHSAPESPPTPGPEVVPWTSPTTVTALGHAQGV